MKNHADPKPESRSDMMLQGPVSRIVFRMALPTIMSFLIDSVYSITDTYFVSTLGTDATAAVSVNSSLDLLILMMGSFLAVGAASYIARLLGKNDAETASSVLSTAFFSAMAFGTVILITGELFTLPLVRFLGATASCEGYAADYTRFMLLGAPFMPACFVMNHCLRSEGYATYSMIGMCTSSIVNCILDPIFIFLLNMGIAGAALATTVSKMIMFVILVLHYASHHSVMKLSIHRVAWKSHDVIGNIAKVGISSFFRFGLEVLAAILLNNLAGTISAAVLAGVGVCTRIMTFPIGIIHGFCNGIQPVIGINWGAGRYKRVASIRRFCSRAAVAGTFIMAILLLLLARPIVTRFAGTDVQMLETGWLCVTAQSTALPVFAWFSVVNATCTGLGMAKYAVVCAAARKGICFIPVILLLYITCGGTGIAVSQAVADLLTLLLAVPIHIKLTRLIGQKIISGSETAV